MKKEPFNFKGLYFTNHALERMNQRGLKPSEVWAVWHNPQGSRRASVRGAFIYWRDFEDIKFEVVAKKDERGKWVVISVWSRKILRGKKESLFSLLLKRVKEALSLSFF